MNRDSRLTLLLAIVGWLMTGCSKEPSAEQKQADSTFAKARNAFEAGDYSEARYLLRAAYTLDRELGRTARMAEQQRLLGDAYATVAEFDSALECYVQAGDHFKSIADRSSARGMTLQIASIHRFIGEERKAFAIYDETLRLADVFGDIAGAQTIRWGMLPTCRTLDNMEEETRVLSNLLDTYIASADVNKQAKVYYESGVSRLQRRDHAGALDHLLRALTFAEQTRDSLLSISVLVRLALTYDAMGQTFEAFQAYSDGLKRSDRTRGAGALREEMLTRVGNIYLRTHQPAEAARFYRAALNSALRGKNRLGEGYLFIQLGHCALGQPRGADEALKNYQSALSLFEGVLYAPGIAYARLSLGLAAERARRFTEALQYFKSAVEQSEQFLWRRPSDDLYLECENAFLQPQRTSPYEAMVELLLQLGRYEEAFWYMDRRQANALFTVLSSFDTRTLSDTLSSAMGQFQHARALRIGAEKRLADVLATSRMGKDLVTEITAMLDERSKTLEEARERVVQVDNDLEPAVRVRNIGLAEVQRLLPRGAAFVEHVATKRSLFMFVATASKAAVQVAAIDKISVISHAREFSSLIQSRALYADSSALLQLRMDHRIQELTTILYSAFIRPIERDIAGASKLLVVLQPEFATLPLHVLRRAQSRGNPYVAEQYMVSYLPTGFALMLKPAPPRHVVSPGSRSPIAAMSGGRASNRFSEASPGRRMSDQPEDEPEAPEIIGIGHAGGTLWDVEYELRDIRAFYKDARLHFNQQATLASIQREHGDLLHLAAEFQYNDREPGNSYLVLSDGKAFNTTTQILWGGLFSLPAFSTMIISDLGERQSSIQPCLPYIFLANGCAAVITQAYTPLRKTKKYFGEIFYTALLSGSSSQRAMKQVQVEMIRNPDYSAPHLWAPFFLWGK